MDDNQQWVKLFKYLDKRFAAVDKRFDSMDEKFSLLLTSVHGIAANEADNNVDRKLTDAKVEKHDVWIHQLANKAGLELSQ